MAQQGKAPEHERRDWTIILIILLLGFLFVILAANWAIRFAPAWTLNANMGSNIDPNSDFTANRPVSLIEPLDPAILTPPAWINVFLTPGASFETALPAPTSLPVNTPLATSTTIPTATSFPTNTFIIPVFTNTVVYLPPPPSKTPKPPATALPQADLQITKTDGVTTYFENGSTTYTIVVTNAGPNNVTGAVVTDNFPSQIAAANWTCAPSGGATGAVNGSGNISASVNLPVGSSVTYTVSAAIGSGVSGDLVNTATVSVPSGYTDPNMGSNTATDTDTFTLAADLQITKTDNATAYIAGAVKTYVIVVSNAGPSDVTGATVMDTFSTNTNIVSTTWTCTPSGSATCTAGGSGDINDSVNLPAGSTVTYTVTATVSASPSGDLVNAANVTAPPGVTDLASGNNSATDTDKLIRTDTLPPQIGVTPPYADGTYYNLLEGTTLTLNIPVVANGDIGVPDFAYYEYLVPSNGNVYMDMAIVQISDGSNWYTVFNWGDELRDTNTNLDYTLLPPPTTYTPPPQELDERDIPGTYFPNGSDIRIDIDPIVPPGTYNWIRFYAPPDNNDHKLEIDGIQILP